MSYRREGVGGAAERPSARGKFSETGSKTGPSGAFCANGEVDTWISPFCNVLKVKHQYVIWTF